MAAAMENVILCPFVNRENARWIVTLPMAVQVATEPQLVPEDTAQAVVLVLTVDGSGPSTVVT